jgi:hypothetical protein
VLVTYCRGKRSAGVLKARERTNDMVNMQCTDYIGGKDKGTQDAYDLIMDD